MRYTSTLLEPSTPYTTAYLTLGIVFFVFFIALLGLIFRTLMQNMKYLLQTKGTQILPQQQEERLKGYKVLFDEYDRKKRIQILYIPISMLQNLLYVSVIALLNIPLAQISLIWVLDTMFIIYLVVYQPLKERSVRIMTLLIELLSYGCITLAFILGLIDRFIDLDSTTLGEIGFVF